MRSLIRALVVFGLLFPLLGISSASADHGVPHEEITLELQATGDEEPYHPVPGPYLWAGGCSQYGQSRYVIFETGIGQVAMEAWFRTREGIPSYGHGHKTCEFVYCRWLGRANPQSPNRRVTNTKVSSNFWVWVLDAWCSSP